MYEVCTSYVRTYVGYQGLLLAASEAGRVDGRVELKYCNAGAKQQQDTANAMRYL